MKLDKFLGSKTKSDILKYLIFRRQGVSMRAMSNDIARTFPAIKKQIDSLEQSEIIMIERENNKFYIILNPEIADVIKNLYTVGIKMDMIACFEEHVADVEQFYFGKLFGTQSDIDLVVVHHEYDLWHVQELKHQINQIFRSYFIDSASIVFLSSNEWSRRYRLADKFVLSIIRNTIKWPLLQIPKKLHKPPLIIDPEDQNWPETSHELEKSPSISQSYDTLHWDKWSKSWRITPTHTVITKPIQPQLL